ncbi:hypothetical protein [Infirmifilum uzonense]|uniref:hypothetical protein n=1 Tax=Infirmifilum uzonense TaxID=1550241 RepID=UPI000AD5462C|nr:hypothetical protein [Infirmifilum uzonense]
MPSRRSLYISFSVIALIVALLMVIYSPLGLQAVVAGKIKDIVVQPSSLTLYASRARTFCYSNVIQVSNQGNAGLSYMLNFSLEGAPEYFEARAGNKSALILGKGVAVAKQLELGPGESMGLTICVLPPSPPQLVMRIWDPRYPAATEQAIKITVAETDWWDNGFPRRISLTPVTSREGVVLFEILGSGDVYANGLRVGRIPPLQDMRSDSIAVVYVKENMSFLLPFQVEAWERDSDGVVRPKGLRNETIREYDRLVFAAHVSNDSRIDIYTGGKMRESFNPGLSYSDNIFEAKGFRVQLEESGFTAPGTYVNLSGRIAYTYQQHKTYYSDPGKWRLVAVGPVRALAAFNTSGLSEYTSEAFLAFWGLGLNSVSVEVWPSVTYRGIILEWDLPLIRGNASIRFICGTTCNTLPARLEAWGVRLCENYWTPGARYGHFTLLFNWTALGEVKMFRVRISSFPGV